MDRSTIRRRLAWVAVVWLGLTSPTLAGRDAPLPGDDATFRPTVMVRKGRMLGSGTVIASTLGETLVLTAWHVVEGPGALELEVFRFNLGMERERHAVGYPRRFKATIEARDVDADLAILRVVGQRAFPYVARLAPGSGSPEEGTPVTTIGFDRGDRLIGCSTAVRRVERVDMDRGGGDRPFLVTDHPPEIGRSGGGLFGPDGKLVGVCVARVEFQKGRTSGLFSTLGNVRALLETRKDLARAVNPAKAPAVERTVGRSPSN